MRSKLKNFSLLLFVVFLFLVSMFSILALSSCTTHKTILSANYNDDLNLNISDYTLDNDGNIVSSNLFNPNFPYRDNGFYDNSNNWHSNSSYRTYIFTLPSGTYTYSSSAYIYSSLGYYNSGSPSVIIGLSDTRTRTFTTNGNQLYLSINYGVVGTSLMLNSGSTALPYEPFNIWYPGTNLNNPFYNSSLYYYFNSSTTIYAYDVYLNDSILNGNTFIYPYRAIQTKYSSEDLRAYIEDTQLGYWRLDFAKPYPVSMLNFKVLCTTTANFDYCITYYFNDGSNYVYHNTISSSLTEFIIDLSEVSNLSDKECIYMTWRRQSSYEINCLSMANYELGFIDGSNEGYNKALKELDIDSYKTQISDLEQEITDLEYSLERAQERAQNSLDHLTYSMIGAVMSTPFNILHDYLNWNFFGINLFSLFTSLVTLLLIIWVIKFLLGRK